MYTGSITIPRRVCVWVIYTGNRDLPRWSFSDVDQQERKKKDSQNVKPAAAACFRCSKTSNLARVVNSPQIR